MGATPKRKISKARRGKRTRAKLITASQLARFKNRNSVRKSKS